MPVRERERDDLPFPICPCSTERSGGDLMFLGFRIYDLGDVRWDGEMWDRRGATLEISQTRSLVCVRLMICPEGTMENILDVSAVPSGRNEFMDDFPDIPCLANFRLCLRHEGSGGAN